MRRAHHVIGAVWLIMASAAPAAAQAVRGQLVDRSNGRPITGGFVVLLNEQEQEIARALTDTQGRFVLRAPAPGTYRLQSKRIGFRLTTSPPLQLAQNQMVGYRLEVDAVPASLPPVIVEGRPQCGTRGEQGTVVARLWEETREALAAVSWTAGQNVHRYTLRKVERELPPAGLRVLNERSSTSSGYAESPYLSVPAERLARTGYVVMGPRDTVDYFAPDANVLLSNVFVDTHCFTTREGSGENAGLVGLAFAPAPNRTLPDVRGVLWIDKISQELRTLEFQYANLPAGMPEGAVGGRVEFMRLPSGAWIVLRWSIRMARMGRIEYRGTGRAPESTVVGYREEGGQVMSIASRRGAVLYSAVEAILEGTAHDSTRGAPLAGAEVFLVGTDVQVTADNSGRFQITAPVEGVYGVSFRHPRLDSLRYVPEPVPATMRSGQRSAVTVAIPPEERFLPQLCPESLLAETDRVVVGTVRDRGGRAAPGAVVRVAWQSVGGTQGATLRANDWTQVVTADSSGAFVVCGVPPAVVTVSARADAGSTLPLSLRFTEAGVWIGNRYRSFPSRIWTQELTLGR